MIRWFGLMIMSVMLSFASEINWQSDFDKGLNMAKMANKPVMFLISSHQCRFCVKLEKETLATPEVTAYLNDHFVPIVVYVDENPEFPEAYMMGGTPTTWFLLSDGKPMFQPLVGFVPKADFLKALTIVKEEYEKIRP